MAFEAAVYSGIKTIEQPEPLAILRRLRRFNLPMWAGGYADQPYIHMLEQNIVVEAEIEMDNIKALNAQLRTQHESTSGPGTPG